MPLSSSSEPAAYEPFLVTLDAPSERVRQVIEPAIDAAGCELVLLQVRRQPRTATVRIFVDLKGEETIGIEQLQSLNRELGDLLDVEDAHEGLFPGTWDLEVSSPGIDRPLTKRSHFEAAVGERVKIKGRTLAGGRVTLRGELKAVNEDGVEVDDDGDVATLSFDEISDANTIFEFGEQKKPKPKRKKKNKNSSGADAQDRADSEKKSA